MAALKGSVLDETLAEVDVVYLGGSVKKWWNARRDKDDTPGFCGWYWSGGNMEGGPFMSRSAAVRDAWYKVVRRAKAPPSMAHAADQMKQGKRRANGAGKRYQADAHAS